MVRRRRVNDLFSALSEGPRKKNELKRMFGYARTFRLNRHLAALEAQGKIEYVFGKGYRAKNRRGPLN